MIISKRHTPKYNIGFSFTVRNCLVAFLRLVSQWESRLRSRTYVFVEFVPLCSAYNSYTRQGARKPDLACMYQTCMRASATRLVRTRVLCTRVSTSSILRAHCMRVK